MRFEAKWFAVAAVAAMVAVGGNAAAEGTRIAVIDVARILNESEAGKTARKKLEARFEELRKTVESKKDEAQKIKDDLDKMKMLMDKDKGKAKLKEKEEKLAAKAAEFEKARQEAEKEMQGRQSDLAKEILKAVETKVSKVIDDEKIDLLLDSAQGNIVLHAAPSIDITSKVLEMMNKDNPAEKGGESGGK